MKTNRKHLLFVLTAILTLALLLASCGGSNDGGNNENDPDAAITHVVETAMMAITLTEAVQPATSTPLPSSTPLPTSTPIPTMAASPTAAAAVPTATSSFVQPTNVASGCDSAGFVADVTIPDGSVIEASTAFTKTWELTNNGTCTWNSGYQIVYYGGDQLADDTIFTFTDEDVEPGESIQISVEMTSPASNGNYTSYWILRNDVGQNFFIDGGSIYVQITVGTATQAPTATSGTPSNNPPTISISADDLDLIVSVGDDVQFTAVVDDVEDDPFNPTVTWYENAIDLSKPGNPLNRRFSTAGTFVITATVTDSDGNTTTSNEITITVNATP